MYRSVQVSIVSSSLYQVLYWHMHISDRINIECNIDVHNLLLRSNEFTQWIDLNNHLHVLYHHIAVYGGVICSAQLNKIPQRVEYYNKLTNIQNRLFNDIGTRRFPSAIQVTVGVLRAHWHNDIDRLPCNCLSTMVVVMNVGKLICQYGPQCRENLSKVQEHFGLWSSIIWRPWDCLCCTGILVIWQLVLL